ncbi:hypothetical protein PDESU_00777 [Pontiella desulfatans]|uniref:Uncharacterized protein n=1 Tax=Pontiella desulfatans TaxID=2750659 RepID=A0A6C2TYF3_PONDE|nr:hypothetical protein [Pontiella desulfatans]VGO12226.1 hypothetical protein PDESU_00777 [Pontiella desulfatans]
MKPSILIVLSIPALVLAAPKPTLVEYSVRTPIQRRNLKLAVSGQHYYIATNGNDANPGTKAEPFRTIQRRSDLVS